MSVAEMFSDFVGNLAIGNAETISTRYGELTSALNKQFRDTESKTANTLQVGSFGRKTGINGISDLDMLYIMPKTKWGDYNKAGGQLSLLQDTKEAILKRYPTTKVKVDRLVVTVTYTNFHVEVQPVFEQGDQSYLYPDTKNGGSWKTTKPREEMTAVADLDTKKNANLRPLCKMARAWKNKHGVGMGGLLLDTLAYNFLASTTDFDTKSFLYYDWMSRDFFKYLSELPEQSEYAAPGSRQRVKVKKKFQNKAKKTYKLCLEAIEAEPRRTSTISGRKFMGDHSQQHKEERIARAATAEVAIVAIEKMEERLATDAEENIDNQLLKEVSSRVIGNLRRRADGRNDVESSLQEENLERRFRLAALRSERAELYHLRATRQISNETLQKLLHDLDLLEALLIENQ